MPFLLLVAVLVFVAWLPYTVRHSRNGEQYSNESYRNQEPVTVTHQRCSFLTFSFT